MMTTRLLLLSACYCLFGAVAACDDDHDHAHDHPHVGGADAGDPDHKDAHTERVDLGKVQIGAISVQVFRVAPLVAGKEGDFDLDFAADQKLPATIRGWIGLESAQGSRKALFDKEGEHRMHGHPVAPDPMPEGSRLWLDVEGFGLGSVSLR